MAEPDSPSQAEIAAALREAKRRLKAQCVEWYYFSQILRDGRELGLHSAQEIRTALLIALEDELTCEHYSGPHPPTEAYDHPPAPAWILVWDSAVCHCRMYFKFCLYEDDVVVYSFHRERPQPRRTR